MFHPRVGTACFDLYRVFESTATGRGKKEREKKKRRMKCIDRTDCCNWRNAVVSSARTDNSVHTIRPWRYIAPDSKTNLDGRQNAVCRSLHVLRLSRLVKKKSAYEYRIRLELLLRVKIRGNFWLQRQKKWLRHDAGTYKFKEKKWYLNGIIFTFQIDSILSPLALGSVESRIYDTRNSGD